MQNELRYGKGGADFSILGIEFSNDSVNAIIGVDILDKYWDDTGEAVETIVYGTVLKFSLFENLF